MVERTWRRGRSLTTRSQLMDDDRETEIATYLPPRPKTSMDGRLHSSSIHVTDISPTKINPTPKESHLMTSGESSDQFLSPNRLRAAARQDDLSQVSYLELVVDTSTTSIGNFGIHLPQLTQLHLAQSTVRSVRDLGTSLTKLRVLQLPNCSLRDLDGLAALASLQELYAAFNHISDVSLVSMLSELEVLDLQSNELSQLDQIGYLALCPKMSILTLRNNPLSVQLEGKSTNHYQSFVKTSIPQLKILDDKPFEGEDLGSLQLSRSSLLSHSHVASCQELNKGLQTLIQQQQETITSSLDDSSDLTHGLGQVMCGNPVRVLKARHKHGLSSQSMVITRQDGAREDVGQIPTGVPLLTGSEKRQPASSKQRPYTSSALDSTRQPNRLSHPVPHPPAGPRPHTASDFRQRRYQVVQPPRQVQNVNTGRGSLTDDLQETASMTDSFNRFLDISGKDLSD